MKKSKGELQKLDRKTVEKNRRIHMKGLCFKLSSLLPPHFKHSKQMQAQPDQLHQAAAYIKQLKERLEKLKKKEEELRSLGIGNSRNCRRNYKEKREETTRYPVVEVRDFGSNIEVVIISGLKKNFMLYQIITILEEEGAEVVTATFSTVADNIFHSIHAQVKIPRVGVETSRVCRRLQELVYLGCMSNPFM